MCTKVTNDTCQMTVFPFDYLSVKSQSAVSTVRYQDRCTSMSAAVDVGRKATDMLPHSVQ